MDRSPALENFMNKMATMQGQGKPKINATRMKVGSGLGLEERVINNERKITLLKNIFKAQKEEIGQKITPKVNTLEQSLIETTDILGVISRKLQVDISQRIRDQKDALENQRKLNLLGKRDKKEEELEEKKKLKKTSKLGKAVVKPFVGMFDKLKELALILGTGILGTNFIRALQDEDFQKKLKGVYDWTTKNWKALAIAGGVLIGLDLGLKLFGAIKALKFAFGILSSPILLKALGIAAVTFGVFYLLKKAGNFLSQKMVQNLEYREETKQNQLSYADPVLARTFSALKNANNMKDFELEGLNQIVGFGPASYDFEKIEDYLEYLRLDPYEVYKQAGIVPFNLTDLATDRTNLENEYKNLVKDNVIQEPTINFVDGGTVDLRENNQIKEFKLNNLPATQINSIASMNVLNPYMEQVPQLFGFSDLVYS